MLIRTALIACTVVLGTSCWSFSQTTPGSGPRVNQDSILIQDFESRIADYVRLHKKAEAGSQAPKQTASPGKLAEQRDATAPKVVAARPSAKQGEIFTPEIGRLFQRLIAAPLSGPDGKKIMASLRNDEPVAAFRLQVNAPYPDKIPLQTTPPTLLMDLPQLPPELEYRIVGRDLVLRDVANNLIVDFIPGALPPS